MPEREVHPSLWFKESDIDTLKTRFTKDQTARSYWKAVKEHRYLTIPIPPPVKLEEGNQAVHRYYGDMTQLAAYNAFMFLFEENKKQKQYYLDRAKQALLRAYDGPIYQLDPRKSGIDKSVDEIYRGVWSQTLAAAYDFIQPFLSADEDREIRRRLVKEAAYTYKDLDTWAKRPHNHLSKPAWGLASLALVLSDHPDAKNWLTKAHRAANRNTAYHFSADGIYREGAQYYIFSWINYVPYLYHYKNVSDVNLFETFLPSMEWGLIARNGRGWMMNIEDSYIRPVPTQMVTTPYLAYRSRLNPDVPFGEILQWGFENTDFEPFNQVEKKTGFNYTGASWDYPKELYELITYNPDVRSSPPSIDPTIFMAGGQSIFRNQWLDDDKEQMFLLFHGVPHADNHDHHDHLSFIIYAKGQMMASDSGYSRKSYGEDIRYQWYRLAPAHNTLTLNDIPLGDSVENQPPASDSRLNTAFFDFEQKAAPFRLYLDEPIGHAKRAVAFIQDEYFLVIDEAKTLDGKKGRFAAYFHGGRAKLRRAGKQFFWQYDADEYGPEAQLLTQQFHSNATIEIKKGETTYIKSDYVQTPMLKIEKQASEALLAQILYPLGEGETPPEISDLSTSTYLAATVKSPNGNDIFFKKAGREKLKVEALESDATFAWQRKTVAGTQQFAIQQGTYIDYAGKNYLRTTEPVSLAIEYGETGYTGAVEVERKTRFKLQWPQRPITSITLNGNAIAFSVEKGAIVYSLEESGNLVIR
ncbi:heparinase II/III domain-containing protein [Exilibacterium tricleocarpae]|uniref:heparinase II/III domain-containing protein n=1 Tax=Exilibacterium tricleocarpae TaxID=2591008 RepID=UPI0015D3AEEA|nr:heparinase II/III family protein [Exilibacterium tricleocarpae]